MQFKFFFLFQSGLYTPFCIKPTFPSFFIQDDLGTLSNAKTFGDHDVGLYNEDILPDYTIRTLKVNHVSSTYIHNIRYFMAYTVLQTFFERESFSGCSKITKKCTFLRILTICSKK